MRHQQALVLLVLVAFAAGACRKDKDTSAPTITILAPGAGATLAVPAQLAVRVAIEDDRHVESVWIGLTDAQGVPIAAPITAFPGAPSAVVEGILSVTDERTAQGTYTITVRASDGANQRQAFGSVNVLAAPLRLRAVYLVPPPGAAPAAVLRIDSTGAQEVVATLPEIGGAAVDGYSQHVFVAGGVSAPMQALPTAPWSNAWQLPNLNASGTPYFSALRVDPGDGRLYVCMNDGAIRGFRGDGSPTFNAQALPGYRSTHTAVAGQWIVSAQASIPTSPRRLVVLAAASGQQVAAFNLGPEPVHLDHRTGQRVLVFGNDPQGGVVQEHEIPTGGGQLLRTFAGENITGVARLGDTSWAIALPGRIVRWNASTNATAVLASFGPSAIAFEASSGTLLAAHGSELVQLDPFTGASLGGTPLPFVPGAVLPLLNR